MKRRNTFRAALALLLILTLCMPAAASGFTGKLIAITFDDGPGAYTAQLLDELAARDVKATFFVSGYRAANYPETLKRMVSEGHQLASHTQNHENLNTLSAAKSQTKSAGHRTTSQPPVETTPPTSARPMATPTKPSARRRLRR